MIFGDFYAVHCRESTFEVLSSNGHRSKLWWLNASSLLPCECDATLARSALR